MYGIVKKFKKVTTVTKLKRCDFKVANKQSMNYDHAWQDGPRHHLQRQSYETLVYIIMAASNYLKGSAISWNNC